MKKFATVGEALRIYYAKADKLMCPKTAVYEPRETDGERRDVNDAMIDLVAIGVCFKGLTRAERFTLDQLYGKGGLPLREVADALGEKFKRGVRLEDRQRRIKRFTPDKVITLRRRAEAKVWANLKRRGLTFGS